MWSLEFTKYSPVWCKHDPISPWLVNEIAFKRIKKNAAYIQELRHHQSAKDYDNIIFKIDQLERKEFELPEINSQQTIDLLSLSSIGLPPGNFISKKDYIDFLNTADVLLSTEKFFGPKPFYSGSSRHALLYDVELKGIGRNSLVTDFEFTHSSGSLTAYDAFKGLISGFVINQRSQLPELECLGLCSYNEHSTESIPNSIVIRSSDSYRLAHCWPSQMSFEEKAVIQGFLKGRYPNTSSEQILETIIENYIHAFSSGILHRSPSFDNLLVDGRWIDSESLDFTLKPETYPAFIQLFVADEDRSLHFSSGPALDDIVDAFPKAQFYGSWIHQLRYACLAHHQFFTEFDSNFSMDLNQIFKSFLEKHIPYDISFWNEILLKYPVRHDVNYKYSSATGLHFFREKSDTSSFKNFSLHGHFYDTLLKGWILYFSDREDPHIKCVNTIKKLFRLYPPRQLTWEESFLDYQAVKESSRQLFS